MLIVNKIKELICRYKQSNADWEDYRYTAGYGTSPWAISDEVFWDLKICQAFIREDYKDCYIRGTLSEEEFGEKLLQVEENLPAKLNDYSLDVLISLLKMSVLQVREEINESEVEGFIKQLAYTKQLY